MVYKRVSIAVFKQRCMLSFPDNTFAIRNLDPRPDCFLLLGHAHFGIRLGRDRYRREGIDRWGEGECDHCKPGVLDLYH